MSADARAHPPLRVLAVLGTRPEAIKMAPLVHRLAERGPAVVGRVCVTAQHRELLDDALELFGIAPDYDLDVMRPGQSPTQVAAEILRRLEPVLVDVRPDWVVVQGDTTTAAIGALAAFYAGARVAHVEAGLRSHEPREPFPEEVNRRVAAVVADLHLAPTPAARDNLLREGVDPAAVRVTGNTVIDALHHARTLPLAASSVLDRVPADRPLVLVTAHRRESFGPPLERICAAIDELTRRVPEARIVFPAHPNPAVRAVTEPMLGSNPRVILIPPVGYREMVALLERARVVLTDSGGLQEEAPGLGAPVLVLRDVTERQEGVEAGTVRLVGSDPERIVSEAVELLRSDAAHAAMARAANPYGDGRAAERIVAALLGEPVDEWTGAVDRREPSRARRSLRNAPRGSSSGRSRATRR